MRRALRAIGASSSLTLNREIATHDAGPWGAAPIRHRGALIADLPRAASSSSVRLLFKVV